MTKKYASDEHRGYLTTIDRVGRHWITVFEDDFTFWSADYWDLFTGMWKEIHDGGKNIFIRNEINTFVRVGPKKVGDMVKNAIDKGYLEEVDDPRDRRQRAVRMSDTMRARMEQFLDNAVHEMKQSFGT